MNSPTYNHELVCALIDQVTTAVPKGLSERFVTTLISSALWREWCKIHGDPIDSVPTEWIGNKTRRIYGSATIVVSCDKLIAISFARDTISLKLAHSLMERLDT